MNSRSKLLPIWKFVRGDTGEREFERWVYESAHLEELLGSELYLDLISVNFHDCNAVEDLRGRLFSWAKEEDGLLCRCVSLPDQAVVDMGEDHIAVFSTLEKEGSRGGKAWWLSVYSCSVCQDWWLVASEERHNDVYIMRRLLDAEVTSINNEGVWPRDFDRFEELLRIGRDAGRAVRFIDPWNSSPLQTTIEELATDRPGIPVSDLASLLNLDDSLASQLAHAVVKAKKVDIKFDVGK